MRGVNWGCLVALAVVLAVDVLMLMALRALCMALLAAFGAAA